MAARSTRRHRCAHDVVPIAAVAIAVLLTAGCGTADPSDGEAAVLTPPPASSAPPSEPAPTLDDAARLEQDNVDAAEQLVVDYWATSAEVGARGYEDWQAAFNPLVGPNIWATYAETWAEREAEGARSEGAVEVSDLTVTAYEPSDNGFERVTLDACTDYAGITGFDGDGTPHERSADTPLRYTTEYVVAHQGTGAPWVVAEMTPRPEETC